jgi:mRNA-degrading endonuclease toxin of MazEF toxin-antitoxin module
MFSIIGKDLKTKIFSDIFRVDLNNVIVAEITTKGKGYPTEVFFNQIANLPKPSFVQTDNIHTVLKKRLGKFIGTLDSDTMLEISRRVVLALEMENCMQEI